VKHLIWIHTRCDWCEAEGLRVLVPRAEDGSVAGKEFPSLCAKCFGDRQKREAFEARIARVEGTEPPA
jgi:hypothetical protein